VEQQEDMGEEMVDKEIWEQLSLARNTRSTVQHVADYNVKENLEK
jgi:hypothetical protein